MRRLEEGWMGEIKWFELCSRIQERKREGKTLQIWKGMKEKEAVERRKKEEKKMSSIPGSERTMEDCLFVCL